MQIGDLVKVINWGQECTTYTNWFISHIDKLDSTFLIRYAYNDNANFKKFEHTCEDNRIFEVLFIDDKEGLALISLPDRSSTFLDNDYQKIFLIGCNALDPVKKESKVHPMTLKEIEKELGYKVSIISE